jgi:hypothetical protein
MPPPRTSKNEREERMRFQRATMIGLRPCSSRIVSAGLSMAGVAGSR